MELFSPPHLAVLGATAALAVGLAAAARRDPRAPWVTRASRALAGVLVANEVAFHALLLARGDLTARADLPLHLTDAATIAAAVALWRPAPLAFELTWFWGMTATVQALLTPDLVRGPEHHRFWWFVIAHAGVVVAAFLLAWGRGLTPRPGAVPRVFGWSALVAAAAAAGSLATGGNYMFLRRPPARPSLLDHLGPWPWYLVSAAALAIALFWLLDLPFRRRRREVAAAP